jgi:hypothetical protein
MSNVEEMDDKWIDGLTTVLTNENPKDKVKQLKLYLGGKPVLEVLDSIVNSIIQLTFNFLFYIFTD